MAIPNKSPLKILEKMERIMERYSVSRDCPNFLGTPYYLGNGNFKFGEYIYRANPNKSP